MFLVQYWSEAAGWITYHHAETEDEAIEMMDWYMPGNPERQVVEVEDD